MPLKRYACTVHPNLRIQSQVKFNGGFFQTSNPTLQSLVEKNDLFGWGIQEVPQVQDMHVPEAPKIKEMDDAVAAVMAELGDGLDIEELSPEPEETDFKELQKESRNKPIDQLRASDINIMTKADLEALQTEIGAEIPPGRKVTVAVLRRACRKKLGV